VPSSVPESRLTSSLPAYPYPVTSVLFVALAFIAIYIHFGVLVMLGPRKPTGDEQDYLNRGAWTDPHRPVEYLRVPLFPALFQAAHHHCRDPERCLRVLGAMLGSISVVLVGAAGWRADGPVTGMLAAGIMMLWVERLFLASHLWPDTLLCCLHALALYLLQWPPSVAIAAALGMVVLLATLVRIEQLALAVGLLAVLVLLEPINWVMWLTCIGGPVVLALAVWTGIAWHRYRVPLPDTTWLFNLELLQAQVSRSTTGKLSVQETINQLLQSTPSTNGSMQRLGWGLLRSPVSLSLSMLRRLIACFGPDTFIQARLLPPTGEAYPGLSPSRARYWAFLVRWSFPPIALSGLWALAISGTVHWWLVAAIPVLLALVVVHFRSRYRIVLMPWLALSIAQAWLAVASKPPGAAGWGVLLACLWVSALLVEHPPLVEHESQASS